MAKRIKLADIGKVLEKDLATLRRRIVLATHATADDGAQVAAAKAPKAFEELADGIEPIHRKDGATIRSTAPHSGAVENGSRPHMPPIEPIVRWVKLRGMQGLEKGAKGVAREMARRIKSESEAYAFTEVRRGPNAGQMRRRRVQASDIDAPRRIAFMIALKIKAKGTKPTFFMKRSVPEVRKILDAHVRSFLSHSLG